MRPRLSLLLVCTALLGMRSCSAAQPGGRAAEVLAAAGLSGGLIVLLGCDEAQLVAALGIQPNYVIHGLDASAQRIVAARSVLRGLNLGGRVSVEQWQANRLPYADNVVNLVVATAPEWSTLERRGEIMRALAPKGVLLVEQGGGWQKTVKPAAVGVDEWTHYRHDASGNPVAHDTVVAPPRRLQWSEGPPYTRGHEYTPTVAAVVSSGGRLFYLQDEAPVNTVLAPARWRLLAREAHNGILLWKRDVDRWWPQLAMWTAAPRQLHRRVVAVGDAVYATLGLNAPVTALHATTGETRLTYADTEGAEEIVYHRGVLLVTRRAGAAQRTAELAKWDELTRREKSPLSTRDGATPHLQRLRGTIFKSPLELLAFDAQSGRRLWPPAATSIAGLRPLSLCAVGERVFFQRGNDTVCVSLKTGKEQWARPAPRLMAACDQAVLCCDKNTVCALSPTTGEPLWQQKPLLSSIRDLFIIGDSVWVGGFRPYRGKTAKQGDAWGPYFVTQRSLATGEVLSEVAPENPNHHHRCYENKATERFLLGGRRGTEFIDLKSGEVLWNSFARGTCTYGVMPANGLLYTPPHACACYDTAKLIGFSALAPSGRQAETPASGSRLSRGPAYGREAGVAPAADAWPCYRHDAARSGATTTPVSASLRPLWSRALGGRLTGVTLADGRVFVADVEAHRLFALSADTGEPQWDFEAGSRLDSPPTIHRGRAVFGCRDGYVYSVTAEDGQLAWKLRAARVDQRIVVDGQLESVSPAPGSVVVRGDEGFVTAGRSSYLDGGIDLLRFDANTGEVKSITTLYSPDPVTDRQPPQYDQNRMPGVRADLLTADADHVYLRDQVFDTNGQPAAEGEAHLLTLTSFLDDAGAHRSYWIFGTHCSISTGCSRQEKGLLYGRLLVQSQATVYGYGRKSLHWSNELQDGPYRLFAVGRTDRTSKWERNLPIQVRALLLAGDTLFAAGPPVDRTPWDVEDNTEPALLLALSATDGRELSRLTLPAEPVFDGLAAAGGRLYLATREGAVVCLAGA